VQLLIDTIKDAEFLMKIAIVGFPFTGAGVPAVSIVELLLEDGEIVDILVNET
jgi:hypothetical protein